MEEAAQVGPASREETHPRGQNKLKDKRLLIAIATVIILIIVIVSILFLLNNNKKTVSKTNPIDRPAETSIFNALSNEATVYFNETAKSSLREQYIPSEITIGPVTNDKGKIIFPNDYLGTWNIDKIFGKFSVSFKDMAIINTSTIELIIPQKLNNPNTATASEAVGVFYTVQPKGTWACKEITLGGETLTQCENFWIDTNSTKKGVGVISASQTNVYYCEIYPTSKKYSQNSCFNFK